jgi:hypothetical protein
VRLALAWKPVMPEEPPLEDVYLKLLNPGGEAHEPRLRPAGKESPISARTRHLPPGSDRHGGRDLMPVWSP